MQKHFEHTLAESGAIASISNILGPEQLTYDKLKIKWRVSVPWRRLASHFEGVCIYHGLRKPFFGVQMLIGLEPYRFSMMITRFSP